MDSVVKTVERQAELQATSDSDFDFFFSTVRLSSLLNTIKQLEPHTGSYMSVFTCVSTVFWLVNSATRAT